MMENGVEFIVTALPTTAGAFAKRLVHNRSLINATGGAPSVSSSGLNPRPAIGCTPRMLSTFAEKARAAQDLWLAAGEDDVGRRPIDAGVERTSPAHRLPSPQRNPARRSIVIQSCQRHQSVGIRVGQRPHRHGVDDGEHRRIGTDADRQREEGDGGEARLASTAANGVAEILGERLHQRYSAHVTMGLAQLHRAAERHTRRSIRLGVESPRRR